jgi:hypothetical protein
MGILDWTLIIVIAGGAAGLLYRSLRGGGACAGCGNCTCGRDKSPAADTRPADRQGFAGGYPPRIEWENGCLGTTPAGQEKKA